MKYLLMLILVPVAIFAKDPRMEDLESITMAQDIAALPPAITSVEKSNPLDILTRENLERCHNLDIKDVSTKQACETLRKDRPQEIAAFAELDKKIASLNLDVFAAQITSRNGDEISRGREYIEAERKLYETKQRRTLKIYDDACKRTPEDPAVCLSAAAREEIISSNQKELCKHERLHLGYYMVESEKKQAVVQKFIEENYSTDWDKSEIPLMDRCAALLAKDKNVYIADPDYDPSYMVSCKWSEESSRKLISSPGCKKGSQYKVCVAHVDCENRSTGMKFTRMSVCSEDNCGEGDALNCAKEEGYTSETPSEKVILKEENPLSKGAVKQ